jgi:hypothetical protein
VDRDVPCGPEGPHTDAQAPAVLNATRRSRLAQQEHPAPRTGARSPSGKPDGAHAAARNRLVAGFRAIIGPVGPSVEVRVRASSYAESPKRSSGLRHRASAEGSLDLREPAMPCGAARPKNRDLCHRHPALICGVCPSVLPRVPVPAHAVGDRGSDLRRPGGARRRSPGSARTFVPARHREAPFACAKVQVGHACAVHTRRPKAPPRPDRWLAPAAAPCGATCGRPSPDPRPRFIRTVAR